MRGVKIMKIKIDENLYLESDENQLMLKKYSGKLDTQGRETYRVIGYYGNIEHATKSILDRIVLDSDATSFEALRKEVKEKWEEVKRKMEFIS